MHNKKKLNNGFNGKIIWSDVILITIYHFNKLWKKKIS